MFDCSLATTPSLPRHCPGPRSTVKPAGKRGVTSASTNDAHSSSVIAGPRGRAVPNSNSRRPITSADEGHVAAAADRSLEEGDGAVLLLIGEDGCGCDAGVVVDGDVCALLSRSLASASSIALAVSVAGVMRWPMALNWPSFLMSMWMISPG